MLYELKNVCIKIPLLQAIKEIPIFAKTIKDSCIRKPGRKKKEIQKVQLIRKIVEIMMGEITIEKYLNLGSPIVKIHINNVEIPNTLIDLGETINVIMKSYMDESRLTNLQYIPTIL